MITRETRRTFSKDYKLETVRLVIYGYRSPGDNANKTSAEGEICHLKRLLRRVKEENETSVKASGHVKCKTAKLT